MASRTVVTPDMLRSTQQAIEAALQQATAVANDYLSTHEDTPDATWGGTAKHASVNTAGQVQYDIAQILDAGNRLAHGLGQAATLMEQHQADAAHKLTSFAPGATAL